MNATKLIATIDHGQDVYRCELRTLDSGGVDRQWFLNGRPVHGAPRLLSNRRAVSVSSRPSGRGVD